MSSKMRLMRKMTMPDRAVLITSTPAKSSKPAPEYSEQHINPLYTNSSSTSSSATAVRMCFSCNTTKTPLWRSGPAGPKSLCNACGIRQMKARRAMAAAAAASGRLIPADHRPRKISKDEKTSYKGHYEIINAGTSQKKLSIDDRTKLSLSQSSAFHRVFAQDEKDAAILLMALSCGHVHD